MDKSRITIDVLRNTCKSLGYKFFENGDYNLNLIGIRAYPGTINKFDDLICLAYKVDGKWILDKLDATTDPGTYYLLNPMQVKGTAILKEGQYPKAFVLGLHKAKPALVQNVPLPLYRDNNKDNVHDFIESSVVHEMAGINMHRASATGTSVQVDKWSAGCQVVASNSDMEHLLKVVTESTKRYGKTFTYTLLNQKELVL